MSWKLIISHVPPSFNKWERAHWTKISDWKGEWKHDVYYLCREAGVPILPHIDIHAVIFFKYPRKRDQDNYTATFYKLFLDSIKGVIIPDDTPEHVTMHPVIWLTDKENPRTEVTITEL